MACASPFPEHGKSFLGFTNQGCAAVSGRGGVVGFPFTCCGSRLLPESGHSFYYHAWSFTGKFRVAVHIAGSYVSLYILMKPILSCALKERVRHVFSTQTVLSFILKQKYSQVGLLWKQLVFHVKNLRKNVIFKAFFELLHHFIFLYSKAGSGDKQSGTSQTEAVLRE